MESQEKSRDSTRGRKAGSITDAWKAVRRDLNRQIGTDIVRCWIDRLSLRDEGDDSVRLVAPSVFVRNYVRSNFGDAVRRSLAIRLPQAREVLFTVESEGGLPREGVAPGIGGALALAPRPVRATGNSHLLDRYRFDSFVVGDANRLAHASARDLSGAAPPSYRPSLLYLHAGEGQGKTHLLHAIGNAYCSAHPGGRMRCMTAEQFTIEFVQSLQRKTAMGFKDSLRACDLLLLDDIQRMAGRERTQQEFLNILDSLISSDRRVAVTGNRSASEIDGLDSGIRSRLAGGLAVEMRPADTGLRRDFVQRRLEAACASHPHVAVEDGVADLLAQRLPASIRTLEGAVLRLLAEATLVGERVDCDLVLDRLQDLLQLVRQRLSVRDICEAVAHHCGIQPGDLASRRRHRDVVRARQLACLLARKRTDESLTTIGRELGGRSHSTVLHAIRKGGEELARGGRLARDFQEVDRELGG